VTHLVQAGVDLPTVQRISGHKTLSMVARYAHQNGAHLQQAMSKLQDRWAKTSRSAKQIRLFGEQYRGLSFSMFGGFWKIRSEPITQELH
jgi:Phage integrase family